MPDIALDSVLLVTFTAVVLAVPIAYRLAQRSFDPFEPVVLFAAAYGVMFIVRPLAILTTNTMAYERPTRIINISSVFNEMLVLALVGALSFVVGYGLPFGRQIAARAPSPPTVFHTDTAVTAATGIATVGLALFTAFLFQGGGANAILTFLSGRSAAQGALYETSTAYLYYGRYLLIPAAMILVAVGRGQGIVTVKVLGVVAVLGVLVIAAPVGSRMTLLPMIGGIAVFHYLSGMKRPGLATMILVLAAALVLSSVLLQTRSATAREERGVVSIASETLSEPERIFDPLLSGADAEMAATLAAALTEIPEQLPHTFGNSTAGDLITRPVPRLAWADKPLAPREKLISTIWPQEYRAGVANPEFSLVLYFYWDFGVLGVASGMALFGVVAKSVFSYFTLHKHLTSAQLLFAAALPFFAIGVRDSPTDTFIRAAAVLVPIVVVLLMAAKSSTQSSEENASQ